MDFDARIAELEQALRDAADDIEGWASYAGDYFRDKHDLAGCVEGYRRIAGSGPSQQVTGNNGGVS